MEAAVTVKITCLAVGQGLGNLVECYNVDGKLVHLGLMDFGCFETNSQEALKSVQYVRQKMYERSCTEQALAGKEVTDGFLLDFAVFSHQDEDHWSLFDLLLEQKKAKVSRMEYCFLEKKSPPLIEIRCDERRFLEDEISSGYLKSLYCAKGQDDYKRNYIDRKGAGYINTLRYKYMSLYQFSLGKYTYMESCQIEVPGLNAQTAMTVAAFLAFKTDFMQNGVYNEKLTPQRDVSLIMCVMDGRYNPATQTRTMKYHITMNGTLVYSLHGQWDSETGWIFESMPKTCSISFTGKINEDKLLEYETLLADLYPYIETEIPEVRDMETYLIRHCIVGGELESRTRSFQDFVKKINACSLFKQEGEIPLGALSVPLLQNVSYWVICSLDRKADVLSRVTAGSDIDDAILRNFTSAVILLVVCAPSSRPAVLFPGDATTHTMIYMTEHCMKSGVQGRVQWDFGTHYSTADSELFFVPHHGSGNTNRGYLVREDGVELEPYTGFCDFLGKLGPRRCQVSSGIDGRNSTPSFRHPAYELMEHVEALSSLIPDAPHSLYCWKTAASGTDREKSFLQSTKSNYGTAEYDPTTGAPYYSHHEYSIQLDPGSGEVINMTHQRVALPDLPN
ncbi:hypothetical protein [Hungatella hathewayi]|uniref:hypothetical protein n=1 Tax=Hungatella hathewayi TaxID=154046 RepID=UPI003567AD3E